MKKALCQTSFSKGRLSQTRYHLRLKGIHIPFLCDFSPEGSKSDSLTQITRENLLCQFLSFRLSGSKATFHVPATDSRSVFRILLWVTVGMYSSLSLPFTNMF